MHDCTRDLKNGQGYNCTCKEHNHPKVRHTTIKGKTKPAKTVWETTFEAAASTSTALVDLVVVAACITSCTLTFGACGSDRLTTIEEFLGACDPRKEVIVVLTGAVAWVAAVAVVSAIEAMDAAPAGKSSVIGQMSQ